MSDKKTIEEIKFVLKRTIKKLKSKPAEQYTNADMAVISLNTLSDIRDILYGKQNG
jgi:hypothetical protein